MAMGRSFEVDAVVIAAGNLSPASPPEAGLGDLPADLYAADPWAVDALADLPPTAPVLLLGTGLTMVDIAIALDAAGHRGRITALSRRGLAPRAHSGRPPAPPAARRVVAAPLSWRLKQFRRRADEIGWHEAMDELRPHIQSVWRDAGVDERGRFLRHLRPWWDVHRHRMAPAVAGWLERQTLSGRLHLAAGRILSADAEATGARVSWRPRRQTRDETSGFARIINCTGPRADVSKTSDPLLRGLFDSGLVRGDVFGLGLDVQSDGRVIAANGRAEAPIFAVGPITRGAFWEITAVPDIRSQVAGLIEHLAGCLWSSP
jgi:uncharacterized NAD(P)/FAD-binding protein YdhS